MRLDIKKLKKLKKIRIKLIVCFAISVAIPLVLGPLLLQIFEAKNDQLDDYSEVFMYNYQIITGVPITDAVVTTTEGNILIGIISLIYLVFFGILASIVMISVQISSLKEDIH